jgi:hypothetical protein
MNGEGGVEKFDPAPGLKMRDRRRKTLLADFLILPS